MEELVTMSKKELDRMLVLDRVIARTLTQRTAAEMLFMSDRQLRRLLRAYEATGAAALVSKKREQSQAA
jgi:transposase